MKKILYSKPAKCDIAFFARELDSFVPDRVYDVHSHLQHPDFLLSNIPGVPQIIGSDEYLEYIKWILPHRDIAAMFLSFASEASQVSKANEWTSAQVAKNALFRGLYLARPQDDPEFVRQEVKRLKLHGLKVYYTFASGNSRWQANIPEYFPEKFARIAHEEGWVVTLHLVKSRAIADPENIHWIRHYCKMYPNMKLILAHSARGFQPAHNFEGLPQIKDLDNIYFDLSANCEAMAHLAVFKFFGHEKVMYGSDSMIVSHLRGCSVSIEDSFLWLYDTMPIWNVDYQNINPVLVGLENLRSIKWACWAAGLRDHAIEDIFWNNASMLLKVSDSVCARF